MTNKAPQPNPTLADRIDVLERAYEYMLAYAGQDRQSDVGVAPSEIRDHLRRADEALAALATMTVAGLGAPDGAATRPAYAAFLDVMHEDAQKTREAISLALSRAAISSRLIDNVNALIHIRALLTDLFLIDEALKSASS